MKVSLTDSQIREAVRQFVSDGNPPLPEFLDWVADRLCQHHGDDPQVDFIQALRRYSRDARILTAALKGNEIEVS